MLPRPQQRELCMLPIKCALKLVSCGVLRYNRLSVVRVLSIRPYKLTHRERCIEGHNRIHTLAESAEDQFFFLARSLALSIISRAGIFLFLSSCLWATRFTRRIPSRHVHWPHSFARPLRVLALAGWLSQRELRPSSVVRACQARISLSGRCRWRRFAPRARRSLALINICTQGLFALDALPLANESVR